jgi:CxxC motif-containing protein (DUF1111 family)
MSLVTKRCLSRNLCGVSGELMDSGRFMHDCLTFNLTDAIRRHGNQARPARDAFNALRSSEKNDLIAFLLSL